MSSQQELIKLNEVIAECTRLLSDQVKGWQNIVKEINNVNKSAPSSYIKMQKEVADGIAKIDAIEKKYQATVEKGQAIRKRQQEALTTEERFNKQAYQQRERELNQEARWQAQLSKSESLYTKVQAKVNQLTQTYNNLATRKELGLKLNDREVAQLNSLEGRLNKYNNVLKQVDATIGKNQRNVGNYASGWNGLGNSINQITRELPAFTFSAQTGFLALSNNIPILADEIKRVSDNVKVLRAQGQQVPSVMSQILTSFLSWQTALSIGVTLITVYSKEIGEWISKTFKAKEAIDWLAKGKEEFNKITQDGRKNAQQEIIELNNYIKVAQNANLSTNERVKSANKLKETYPEYFKNMTTDQIMTADLTKIQNDLTNALIARATAVASISKMTENATRILDLEEENRLAQEQVDKLKERVKGQQELFNEQVKTGKANVYATQANKTYSEIEETQTAIRERMEEIVNLQIRNARLSKSAQTNTEASSDLGGSKTSGSGSSNSVVETTNEQLELDYKLANQLIENQIKVTKSLTEQMTLRQQQVLLWYAFEVAKAKGNQKEIEVLNAELTGKLIDLNNEEVKAIDSKNDKRTKAEQKTAELVKKAWKGVTDYIQEQLDKQVQAEQEATNKRREGFKDYAKGGFSFSSFGFDSLDIIQNTEFMDDFFKTMQDDSVKTKDKVAAAMRMIGSITEDVFNAMSERQNAYFERQFANLEKEKDVAIGFAGENTAGREAIERQYEEKKVALQREQVKKQKQIAIFSAIINIAQGITASLAQGGPVGIILAALVGVLGAVQIASIASTPLPQFWTGTDNAPEGFALTQEKGAEMITDKNGKIKTIGNNKGAQLTYLNKGDKVYTADETTQKLNELLIGSGVAPIVNTEVNNGLTEEQLERVMNKTLSKQPQNSIIFDEHGIRAYQNRENSRTKLKNRNVKL